MNGTDADVLIFLDCCAAAGSARSAGNGMVEVIAASGFENTTPLRGKHTFTANLVKELQEGLIRSSPGIPTQEIPAVFLHTRLINRLKRYIPTDGREPRITPIHYYLAHGKSVRSIRLGKWEPIPPSTQINAVSNKTSDGQAPTSPENSGAEMRKSLATTAYGDIWPDTMFQYDKVLLAINLSSDIPQDLDIPTFQQWLREVPAFVESVNIEAVYRSRSTLLIASVSIAVWDLLPDHPATTFIGFVSSANLKDLEDPRLYFEDPATWSAESSWPDILHTFLGSMGSWIDPVKRPSSPSFSDQSVYSEQSAIWSARDSMSVSSTTTFIDLGEETTQTAGRSDNTSGSVILKDDVPVPIDTNVGVSINVELSESAKNLPEVPVPNLYPLAKRAQTTPFKTSLSPRNKGWRIGREKIMTHNRYKYKDIACDHEIRLLKVLHGKESDRLECMLFNAALPSSSDQLSASKADSDMYWALSYWWGDGEPKNEIRIYNDTGGRGEIQFMTMFNLFGIFYIRDNLAAALRQCRQRDRDINIWVDAICINQENLEEKTAQVSRMDQVYSGADQVLIWLGAGTADTKETLEFLKSILDRERLDEVIRTKTDPKKWMLVVNLMKNRWFSRIWSVPELALARRATIMWGSEEIEWWKFEDAISLIMVNYVAIRKIFSSLGEYRVSTTTDFLPTSALDPRILSAYTLINTINHLFRRSDNGEIQKRLVSLEELVSVMLLPFECSEPRDKIYAALPLAKDTRRDIKQVVVPSCTSGFMGVVAIVMRNIMWYLVAVLSILVFGAEMLRLTFLDPSQGLPSLTKFLAMYEVITDYFESPLKSYLPHNKPKNHHDTQYYPICLDYHRPLLDVYAEFIEHCVQRSNSLDIICRHWSPRLPKLTTLQMLQGIQLEERLPSWVSSVEGHSFGGPGGILGERRHGDSLVGGPGLPIYNASADLLPYVKFGKHKTTYTSGESSDYRFEADSPNVLPYSATSSGETPLGNYDGTLYIKGFQLGLILKSSGRVSQGVIPKEAFIFGGWKFDRDEEQVPAQLWRTLVADRGPHGASPPSWYRRACVRCLHYANSSGDLNIDQFKNFDDTPNAMVQFLERVQQVVWNRKFFLANGRDRKTLYGLCPPAAEAGDIIAILFGCSVPVLLKKSKSEGKECYILVGECYVYDMMDGEALTLKPEYPYSREKEFILV